MFTVEHKVKIDRHSEYTDANPWCIHTFYAYTVKDISILVIDVFSAGLESLYIRPLLRFADARGTDYTDTTDGLMHLLKNRL